MGWFVSASFVSLLLGLIMVNLLQPGANFPGTLPDGGAIDRPAGLCLLAREIPDASDPDLDRGCHGAERILQIVVFAVFFSVAIGARCRSAPSLC